MARQLNRSWECTLCSAVYCDLSSAVSHIRGAHSSDPGLSFSCNIQGCPTTFKSTNNFYRHVRNAHLQLYEAKLIPCTATVALTERSQEDPPNSNVHAEQDSVNPITSNTAESDESQTTPSSTALAAEDPVAVAAGFLLHFKGKSGITQTVLTELIEMNQAVVGSVLANLSSELTNVLESNEVDLKSPLATRILEAVERQNDQLDGLQTTYRQNLYFQTQYPTVVPVRKELGTHLGTVKRKGKEVLEDIKDEVVYIPFLQNLEMLLQNDALRAQIESGPHQLIGERFGDVCDGEVFKEHPIFSTNQQALQVLAYYDEVETANPIGSKAKVNKIGAVYFTLGNIEPAQRSKLEAIHVAILFPCMLLQRYSIDDIMQPLFDDLQQLSKPGGYPFIIHGQQQYFQGALLAFSGDTPAACKVGGFKEGVGFAERKCRHCMATAEDISEKFVEEEFTLRTKDAHKEQCDMMSDEDVSQAERQYYSKVYGINRSSAISHLDHFDITEQLPQDVMHVLLEGVVPLNSGLFLHHVIVEEGHISVDTLNRKLRSFPYGYYESDKKPPALPWAAIQAGDLTGKQTASQMWCLFHILPLILGEELKENVHYQCFLLLQDICALVLSPDILAEQVPLLRILVQEYLSTFCSLYERPLTPKMHYLVHLPRQIIRLGPPIRLWTMRYEAKHNIFKKWARSTSYKNLCWTLAIRYQQCAAHALSSTIPLGAEVVKFGTSSPVSLSDLTHYSKELVASVGVSIQQKSLYRSSSLKVHGTLYKRGCWLLTGKQSIYGMKYPQFNVVIDILSQGDQHTPLLITRAGQHIKCVEHMRAYSVLCTATSPIEVICPSSLLYYEPFTAVIHDAEVIIKPRVDLYSVLED